MKRKPPPQRRAGSVRGDVYALVRNAIVQGALKPGQRIPSTRTLAAQRNVSRNVVLAACAQLALEGWIERAPARGNFVAVRMPVAVGPRASPVPARVPSPRMHNTIRLGGAPAAFRIGMPALDLFPAASWARIAGRHLRGNMWLGGSVSAGGHLPLRRVIAEHVAVARQIQCAPEQVIITTGAQGGFDLVARTLLKTGDRVWVEDPGYRGLRDALGLAGVQLMPVPVDAHGLDVAQGMRLAADARMACVTPSHQMPLGVTMNLERRLALLAWAARAAAYVLEDDYDSDFQFDGRPLSALHALDRAGRVIYCGTFSKSLFPALRLGYLIAPPGLIDAFLRTQQAMMLYQPLLEQQVLTEFIGDGHFARHLRRMRGVYAERREALARALAGSPLLLAPARSGMAAVAYAETGVALAPAAARAQAAGLSIVRLAQMATRRLTRDGLLLGFAACTPREIAAGARVLLKALFN
jgi:GntR family transcriptional regulator / MocR family aminotransferase